MTNVEPISVNLDFKLYPNPTSFFITIETKDFNSMGNFQLFDIRGKLVLSDKINGETKISVEGLKPGVYTYFFTQDISISRGKLILN